MRRACRSGPLLVLLGALVVPPIAGGQTPTPSRIRELDQALPAILARRHVAGIAVAVIRNGRVTWSAEYGLQGPGTKATDSTLFNGASMAKPVTAETILRLANAGRLSLDESMATALVDPDVAGDPRHVKLTPRVALSHQTGFPNWRRENKGGKLAFLVDPGSRFGYSGEGYNYVARFAEKKLGVPFDALVDEMVFRPIGLRSSSLSSREWMAGRVATPMDTTGRWGKPDLRPAGDWKAADDLFTTARDYAEFMISVMNGDAVRPERAAERISIQVDIGNQWPCVTKPAELCPSRAGFALGWFRFDYGDDQVIWHGGDDWGEHSLAYFYPKTRDGVVVLVNGGSGRFAVTDALDLLDDQSPIERFARARRSPIAAWLSALLEAAYAGKLSGQPKD